jgi:hypothetical protein
MVNVNVYELSVAAPRAAATPRRKSGVWSCRSLADRLEWVALVVLPVTTLVAAVSFLGQAIR